MLTSLVIRKILSWILALFISTGIIAPVSTDNPIRFKDSDSVRMSFVAVSDVHVLDDSFTTYNLSRMFEDVKNSGEKMDAVVISGDLTESGLKDESNALYKMLDAQTVIPAKLLTLGNHDARVFYKQNSKLLGKKEEEYLGINLNGKSYYSYDVNGYTFIMLCTEKALKDKAYISDEQLAFLDSELDRATKDGKPAFVVCHQPLKNTHGLPGVWKDGDIGEQSDQVREILTKHKNIFYLCGHLHDGIYEKSTETLGDGVYSISLPTYRKKNDFGDSRNGTGYYVEVYDDEVIFTARDFRRGEMMNVKYTYSIN